MERNRKGLVLIVSHDPTLVRTMSTALETLGFQVADAIDQRDAIDKIEQRTPQLVCVDLNLPRDSGYEVCEYVRARPDLIRVQILVLSDRSSPVDIAQAEDAGANAFVRKPLQVEHLARYMVSMLECRPPSRPMFRALRPSNFPPST
jgi:CheY-like chemotaxis protein